MKNTVYDVRTLIGGLLVLAIICLAMRVTGGAGFVLTFFGVFAAFGKNRTEWLVYFLLMVAVVTVTNGFIAPKNQVFAISVRLMYALIATVMILQNAVRKNARLVTPLLAIFPYVTFQALASSQGWQPTISYLKLILFVIIFLAFYGIANAASGRERVSFLKVRSVVLVFACFLIFGSLALIPFPGIGKMGAAAALEQGLGVESVGLFHGVTFQPQTLGPAVAVTGVVLFADLLFSIRRWDKLYLALLGGVPVLIFYTSSRTAMGTYLAGMSFVTFVFMCAHGVGGRWKNRALGALTMVGIVGGITLFATPQMREKVAEFALKYTSEGQDLDVSWEAMTVTRQGLMDSAMDNFRASPFIGNGFQVSRQMADMDIVSWKQLLSAPIEKGVWVTAILEEGGVLGMILFLLFLLIAFWGLLSRSAFVGASALFVLMISNFGEFTFFSMSANGGLMWAMVFVGIALDAQRLRQERMQYIGWGHSPIPMPTYGVDSNMNCVTR